MARINGWYYDKQLESPITSVTLHANKWWDEKGGSNGKGEFINWDKIKGENGFGTHGNRCDLDKYERIDGADPNACGYGVDPICTSILNEDFNIAISNTWSEFGGDPIGDMWNSIRGPLSGVTKVFSEQAQTLIENNEKEQINRANTKSKAEGVIMNLVSKGASGIESIKSGYKSKFGRDLDVVGFLNKAIVTQGTRFSYYGGTGIAFGNLGMKFTIFPAWKEGEFIEVQKQVSKLYPYFIGQMESFEDATGVSEDNGMAGDIANRAFMFQKPPGGYLTEMYDVDKIQEGTLKLKIGSFYEISNLVCSDIMLNYSKNMVKNPTTNMISPLFCDVSITLRPSTKYSDRKLKQFVGGSEEGRNAMKKIIEDNITNERTKLENSILTYTIDHDV